MYLSVIVPTYKRMTDLQRLLHSLSIQVEMPEQILVVVGPGDKESYEEVCKWLIKIPSLTVIKAEKASVVHAMNLGLDSVKGDIIAFLDDDACVPLDWSKKIKNAFINNSKIGAYGGRDYLQLGNPKFDNPPLAKRVGIFRWSGVLIGNHHCGCTTSPIDAHVLKGVNLSFRRTAFPKVKIEPALESFGAEICWEIDICLSILKNGYSVIYDNSNYVVHYASTRQSNDNRSDLFSPAGPKRAFNHALIMAKFRPFHENLFSFIRTILIGTHIQPGFFYAIKLSKKKGFKIYALPFRYIRYSIQGMIKGVLLRNTDKTV